MQGMGLPRDGEAGAGTPEVPPEPHHPPALGWGSPAKRSPGRAGDGTRGGAGRLPPPSDAQLFGT